MSDGDRKRNREIIEIIIEMLLVCGACAPRAHEDDDNDMIQT